jgi:hypothetical protein
VLDGALRFWIDGAEREAGPGESAVVPPGGPHAFVVGSPSARVLVINTPAGERCFLEGPPDLVGGTAFAVAGRPRRAGLRFVVLEARSRRADPGPITTTV